MADTLYNAFTNIADAIRLKTGLSATMTPDEMVTNIGNIPSGGDITVEQLNVTSNGTYTAEANHAFGPVVVNVPGANLGEKTITRNGMFLASADGLDGFNSVTVSVPSGGGVDANDYKILVAAPNTTVMDNIFTYSYGANFDYDYAQNLPMMGRDQFNQPTVIGNALTNCYGLFRDMHNFNQPVTIPNGAVRCDYMFSDCWNFNREVNIPDSVTNCARMFQHCRGGGSSQYALNSPIHIGNGAQNCCSMFYNCRFFNQDITIPNNTVNCDYMFDNCGNYNANVTIGSNVTNCYCMFSNCYSFDKEVEIPNSVDSCEHMFRNCSNFNHPVTISSLVTSCNNMFYNCGKFNQDVFIPEAVNKCCNMFYNCKSLSANIYINNTSDVNICNMLWGKNNSLPVNVFCNNISIINKSDWKSFVGESITWEAVTNGFYNASFNIYIYNNYPT